MPTLTDTEIRRLSPAERLNLIGELWDSIGGGDIPVTASQQAELARRLDTFDQDRADGVSWEQLKEQLARRSP